MLIESAFNPVNQPSAGPSSVSTKSQQYPASLSSSKKLVRPIAMLKAVIWFVGSDFTLKDVRHIFSVGRYRKSVISREKGVLRVSARTRSINGAEVGPWRILSFISRTDCLSSASSWIVVRSGPSGVWIWMAFVFAVVSMPAVR